MNTIIRHVKLLFFVAVALCTAAPCAKAGTVLYTDGPSSSAYNAWVIDSGYQVEDSFILSSASTLGSVTFGNALGPGDTALTVDWAIVGYEGSQTPVCSGCSGTASLAGTFDFIMSDLDVYDETFSLPDLNLSAGTYWLELQNETTADDAGAGWDINGGPSDVWESARGDQSGNHCDYYGAGNCSDSFTIYSPSASTTPEPSSLALLGSGVLLLGAEIRRRYRTIR